MWIKYMMVSSLSQKSNGNMVRGPPPAHTSRPLLVVVLVLYVAIVGAFVFDHDSQATICCCVVQV